MPSTAPSSSSFLNATQSFNNPTYQMPVFNSGASQSMVRHLLNASTGEPSVRKTRIIYDKRGNKKKIETVQHSDKDSVQSGYRRVPHSFNIDYLPNNKNWEKTLERQTEEEKKKHKIWEPPEEINGEDGEFEKILESLKDEKKSWSKKSKHGRVSHNNFSDYIEMMGDFEHSIQKDRDMAIIN